MRGPSLRCGVQNSARVIAFFASDGSGFMTGTCVPVNGGIAMD